MKILSKTKSSLRFDEAVGTTQNEHLLLIDQNSTSSTPVEKVEFLPISKEVVMTNNKKPWINSDGSFKTEDQIRESCKTWGATDWEEYLALLEVEQEEALFDEASECEDYSLEENKKTLEGLFSARGFPGFKKHLVSLIKELTLKQQTVINLIYWENNNLREVAEITNCSINAIAKMRDRALKQMAEKMLKNVVSLSVKEQSLGEDQNFQPVEKVENPPISKEVLK